MDPFTIFAVVSAVFGGASVVKQAEAARHAKAQQDVQRQSQNLRAARERLQTRRAAMMSFATAQNNAENGGVGGSSGAMGGQGSIISQGNSALSFLDQQSALANQAGMYADKTTSDINQASMFQGLSKLAAAGMDYYGSLKAPDATAKAPALPSPVGGRPTGRLGYFNKAYNSFGWLKDFGNSVSLGTY